MKVEIIEIIIVCLIVAIQLWVFWGTFLQIRIYKSIIPLISSFKIEKVWVPRDDIELLSPLNILANIDIYRQTSFDSRENKETINIVIIEGKHNIVLASILYSINNYLIRNRGASSDFNLIKDIVERNTNTVEEDINLSVSIPLYLGLMGTMFGIVIGLFNMPDLGLTADTKAKDLMLNDGIGLLIGGVKIAMIASFTGLLLTISNSGWSFKGARSLVESRKNELYTFIQIELLPIINQGLASTLESLQRNLLKFNSEFTTNLRQLSGIFDSSSQSIRAQKELIDAIDKTKVAEMTKYNVRVLQQLDLSVEKFEKFNAYLNNVNLFVENSQLIVDRTNEILSRTNNFETIAFKIDNRLDESMNLMEFLSAHFNKLEQHKEFTSNAVADVGFAISSTFKDLKEHIQSSSNAVKDFTVDELEALKKALGESKTNLSNLEYLATITKDISVFKNNSDSQLLGLKSEIAKNVAQLQLISSQLTSLNNAINNQGVVASVRNIGKWFRSKK